MGRKDYIDKASAILADRSRYSMMLTEQDKTLQVEKIMGKTLRQMKQKGSVEANEFHQIQLTRTMYPDPWAS